MTQNTPAPTAVPPVNSVPPSRRDYGYGWINGKPGGKGR
jgi:hypothetical protein